MKVRGFEKIAAFAAVDFPLPARQTAKAAGYDFYLPQEVTIPAGAMAFVATGVKAYMGEGEFLGMHIRSSMAAKKGLLLVNNIGIIDADYYNNADNEGHIMLALKNTTGQAVVLPKGERVAQGIFYNYLLADGDEGGQALRAGGFGSTGK